MTGQASDGEVLCRLLAATEEAGPTEPPEPISWPGVVHLAQRNGVAPLLFEATRQKSLPIPPANLEQLQQAYYATAALNTRLFDELEQVLDKLATTGIPAIVLKGAALAETVYGNLALRSMVDLDILVPRDLVPDTAQLMEPLGFEALPGPPGHSLAYESRFSGEINLHRGSKAGGLVLDVHWHLLAHQWLHHTMRLDLDALWRAAEPLTLGSLSTRQLCAEDNLIHLCLHSAFGRAYAYLLNLIDIDRSIRAYANLDWSHFVQRARAFQVRAPVYFGLCFALDLLATPVPDRVLAELRPGPVRCWVVERLADPRRTALKGQTSPSASRQYLLHLALIDGPAGWHRLMRFVFCPGDAWLAARYGLQSPVEIRRARLWHPLRVLVSSLGKFLQPLHR